MAAAEAKYEECDRPELAERIRAICTADAPWPEILQRVLALTGEQLNFAVCAYWHLTPDRTALVCRSAWRSPAENGALDEFILFTKNLAFPQGFGLPGRAWQYDDLAISENIDKDRNFVRSAVAHEAKLRAAVATPIRTNGKIIGVLECFDQAPDITSENSLSCLKDVADALGEHTPRDS